MSPSTESETIPAAGSVWSEHRIETLIGRLLQIGVLLASAVVLTGGALLLLRHAHSVPDYRVFRGTVIGLRTVSEIVAGLRSLDPAAIVQAGIILLIATPILRVAFMIVAFALQRDRLYVVLTAIVLVMLLYGFFFAS